MKRFGVFCGSSSGTNPVYLESARKVGALLAKRRIGLVYGGGNIGLMGALADAALAGGAEVIGVIPDTLVQRELAHRGCTELRVVGTMHERKAMMADLAEAFIALPGGFGTLDEFCEVLTWAQLGFHRKPCGLLNVAGFWDLFLRQLNHAVAEGFVRRAHVELMPVESDPVKLLARLEEVRPDAPHKWIDRDRR